MAPTEAASRRESEPAHVDRAWLHECVADLATIERETATPGEREAAEWLVARLEGLGAQARIEEERLHNTYWWPLGIAAATGALGGVAALRGRRLTGAALGALASAAAYTDMPPGRRRLRELLPKRASTCVIAELGPADAERTVVLVAHHDAAHSGLVFHPAIPEIADSAGFIDRSDTSPPLMWPVIGGPAAVATGAAIGSRALVKAGTLVSAGFAAAMVDIGSRAVVPGANDNATGVGVLLAIASALAAEPTESVRVMLVSTSEEGLCEGMEAFGVRHFPELPVESTFILSIDTVGSPHLTVLRGEGMRAMREYPSRALALLDGLAEELEIELFPNLRLRNATDGSIALGAGYQCASLCSVTELKQPANYHWPNDTADRVDYETVADAVRLTEAVLRRLDERWL
jgi:acetylornithine deacetylase/succinyl-diaminopimelate desuccinylase-like protein